MLRTLHSIAGLAAAVLVAVLALSGAVLSVNPVSEWMVAPAVQSGQIHVAALADAVTARRPEVDKIIRTASGSLVVSYFDGDKAGSEVVDPATGAALGPHTPSAFTRVVTNLHRSLLLGQTGRAVAGLGAGAMIVLTISGALMLAARLGGWRAILRPVRGTPTQRWHAEMGRLTMVALMLSSLTGTYMALATFELVPDGSAPASKSSEGAGGPRLPVGKVAALAAVDLTDLRELAFPYAGDPTDTYTLTTSRGVSQIDAATGGVLSFEAHSAGRRIYEFAYMVHTGQGLWPAGLLLGLAALTVPFFAATGALIWWRRFRATPRIRNNASAGSAETIILVGSEGGSTWGFASALHQSLTRAGQRVRTAPMNEIGPRYPRAARMLILTATYGDGTAPASGSAFLARLGGLDIRLPVAVVGFGDRQFPRFCGFADTVSAAMDARGWPSLLSLHRIDRQSAQDFARWGEALGGVLGLDLELKAGPAKPKTVSLALVRRVDYGAEVQAPTAILSFAMPADGRRGRWWRHMFPDRLPRFEPGDIVGIVPPGSGTPRYYSLASATRDGVLEICVRKQPGGLCSTFLHDLEIGGRIDIFIRPNPTFRPTPGKAPLVLIGAGAGIGPLAGFARHNGTGRPIHLYWGGRSPASDFLYRDELAACLADNRLTALRTAFSRVPGGGYVQSRLAEDSAELLGMIRTGAQILVCGGRDMAVGVERTLEAILKPAGLDLARLKEEGRYVADVY
ncbi:MAG: PepSY domain-containing protein [Brevundimonas sp.]|nr:PepSY domain-containing protein [Brevundimonas sp.]